MQRSLLFLLVAVSYLLFAGGPPWTVPPLLALAAVAALAAPRRTFAFPPSQRVLDLSLIALMAGMMIQVLPVPASLAAVLSPQADTVRSALAFSGVGAPPTWTTLSIDREATIRSMAVVALGILAFWVARGVFGAGGSTRSFCRALAVFAAIVAVLALVQRAVTPRLVLFVLPADTRSAHPFGAFVNRNDFAGWLMLVTAPVCGYLIARMRIHPSYRSHRWRESMRHFFGSGTVVTAVSAVVVINVLFATLSRSGIVALGVAALCGWRLGRHRMRIERTSWPAALGLGGAVLLLVMLFLDIDGWAVRLQESLPVGPASWGRLAVWRETLPMIRDFWVTGTGAGTYSDAMVQYQQSRFWVGSMQRWAHFNNAHSAYLQVASEGGVLLALPVLSAVVSLARLGRRAVRADKGEMFWVRAGAAGGLMGLAVQGLWEIPLVMPANAVLCGVLAGLLLFERDGLRTEPPSTDDGLTPINGLNA